MAPKRKRAAPKRRAVASRTKVRAALTRKAELPAAETNTLDYKEFNDRNLVLFENVSPQGFESSAYDGSCNGFQYKLEEGKLIWVEAIDRQYMMDLDDYLGCLAMDVTMGFSLRLAPDGSRAASVPLFFVPLATRRMPLPPKSLACTSSGFPWPTGVLSYGVSRTIAEHLEDAVTLLTMTSVGGMGKGLRFYVGIHAYSGRGQLLIFIMENGASSSSSSSSSSGGGSGEIQVREVVSFGTSGLSRSTLGVLERTIALRGGEMRGVGIDDAPPCNQRGIPQYQVVLPNDMLFDGYPFPPCYSRDGLKIDLYSIQAMFLREDHMAIVDSDLCQGCNECDHWIPDSG